MHGGLKATSPHRLLEMDSSSRGSPSSSGSLRSEGEPTGGGGTASCSHGSFQAEPSPEVFYYHPSQHQKPGLPAPALPSSFGYRPLNAPAADGLRLMGLPKKLPPPEPPTEPIYYPENERSCHGEPKQRELTSLPPDASPVKGLAYPESVDWKLEKNNEYARGWCYVANFDTRTHAQEIDRMLRTVDHPRLSTHEFRDGRPVFDENIPGLLRAVPGVPFVMHIDGKIGHDLTILGVVTPETASGYDTWLGPNGLHETMKRFVQVVMHGQDESPELGLPAFKPIWQYNLYSNTRSGKSHGPDHPHDGSFNIASTRMEGNGDGIIRPALQNSQPEVVCAQWTMNMLLRQMFIVVVPQIISRRELMSWNFYSAVQNTPGIGGMGPVNSAVQMNVSSVIAVAAGDSDSLATSLGNLQGKLHPDCHDDFRLVSMCTLVLRLPEGADPGPFLVARPGIYIRETNTIILFLVFKGNDLHGGRAPHAAREMVDAWEKELAAVLLAQGGKRIVSRWMFVTYPSDALNQRKASVAVTSRNPFGNGGPKSSSDESVLQDFAQHGRHILGTDIDYHNRMAREVAFSFYNSASLFGFEGVEINNLLSMLKFRSGDPAQRHLLTCAPMDDFNQTTEHGRRTYDEGLKHYVWMNHLATRYYMNIGKAQHQERLAYLARCDASSSLAHLSLEIAPPVDFTRPIRLRRFSLDLGRSSADLRPSQLRRFERFPLPASLMQPPSLLKRKCSEPDEPSKRRKHNDEGHDMDIDSPTARYTTEISGSSAQAAAAANEDDALSDLTQLSDEDGEDEIDLPPSQRLPRGWANTKLTFLEFDTRNGRIQARCKSKKPRWFTQDELQEVSAERDRFLEKARKSKIDIKDYDTHSKVFTVIMPGSKVTVPRRRHDLGPYADAVKAFDTSCGLEDLGAVPLLEGLLDSHRLVSCLTTMRATEGAVVAPTESADIPHVWETMRGHLSLIHESASASSPSSLHSGHHGLDLELKRALSSARAAAQIHSLRPRVAMFNSALNWQQCSMTLTLYWFFVKDGPALARTALDTLSTRGSQALHDEFPTCADLFEHLAAYTGHRYLEATKKWLPEVENAEDSLLELEEASDLLRGILPASCMAPLVPSTIAPVNISIPPTSLKFNAKTSPAKAINQLCELFLDTLCKVGMRDSLAELHAVYSRPNVRSTAKGQDAIFAHALNTILIVGGVLDTLYRAFDNSESIFCHPEIASTLTYADLIIHPECENTAQLAQAIRHQKSGHLSDLQQRVHKRLEEQPNLGAVANELSDAVWDHTFGAKSTSLVAQLVGARGKSISRGRRKQPTFRPPWLAEARAMPTAGILLGGAQTLDMSMLRYIVRESLVLHGDSPHPQHPTAAAVFSGHNPFQGQSQSSAFRDRDHWDAVRHKNLNHKVLMDCFDPTDLTSEYGASCLMSFMSVGSGQETREFALAMPWRTLRSLDTCVAEYKRLEDLHPPAFNTRIFGQPSAAFKPRRKVKGIAQLLTQHFAEKWDASLRGRYHQFLYNPDTGVNVLGRDPTKEYIPPSELPTHAAAVVFGKQTNTAGFKSGLTSLQFANNLSLMGIVQQPTIASLADWVVDNNGLGCYHGLTSLGFVLPLTSDVKDRAYRKLWIQGALQCVYDYLESVLTAEERRRCNFGVIFMEHLLCKVSRWKSAFAKNKQDFAEIAREAVEEWAEGSASLDPLMVERILSELATPEPRR